MEPSPRPVKYFKNSRGQRVAAIEAVAEEIKTYSYEVKVVHKSKLESVTNSKFCKKRFSMDLLNAGTLYKATLFDEVAGRFFDELEVNQKYVLSNIQIKPKNNKFNSFSSGYEIVFTEHTVIDSSEASTSGEEVDLSSLIDFTCLSQLGALAHDSLINVKDIKILVVGEKETINSKGIERIKREILLTDPSNASIPLVLWGENCDTFEQKEGDMVILENVKISKYKNLISLWKTYSTKITKIKN